MVGQRWIATSDMPEHGLEALIISDAFARFDRQ